MTLDDRRLSRCIHLLAIAVAVAALAVFLPALARVMGDDLTVRTSLSMAAVFVGLPAMIGFTAWSDRSSARTPLMSAFLALCGILATCAIVAAVQSAATGQAQGAAAFSFGALGVSIGLSAAAAFIRDRRRGGTLTAA